MLERSVPVWVLLLVLLLGTIGTVIFGWMVRDFIERDYRSGGFGRIAASVAEFPNTAITAFGEVWTQVAGDPDLAFRGVDIDPNFDMSGLTPVPVAAGVPLEGLMMRAPAGAPAPVRGWRAMFGNFYIEGRMESAVVFISPDMVVERVLRVSEQGLDIEGVQPPNRKMPHGIDFLPDGSMIFTFDGGSAIQRIDACGNRLWATPGAFSHTVNLSPDGDSVWSVRWNFISEVAVEDGQVLRELSLPDLIAANPEIEIFETRFFFDNFETSNPRNTPPRQLEDPVHYNDAEPLPAEFAAAYPQFDVGDLLISARSLNLVYVLDPDTAKVSWWSSGTQMRQHDPDWRSDGLFSVYDNRMGRDYSWISLIDPQGTFGQRPEILIDGSEMDFYSRIRGKKQWLGGTRYAVTSPQQGRVFEWDTEAGMVHEFLNPSIQTETKLAVITELRVLPEDWGGAGGLPACP